jgi:PAS domain S-box-containing protein
MTKVSEKVKTSLSRLFPSSIQGRLLLLLLLVLVPILLIQGLIYYDRYQTRKQLEFQANLEVARTVGRAFNSFVKDILHHELAIGIAATASPPLSPDDFQRLLEQSARDNPSVRDFSWVTPDGRLIASSNPETVGTDITDRVYFQSILSGREWVISDLILSKNTGKPIFTISRSIRNEQGQLLGMVLAAIDPDLLDDVLALERPKEGGISLIDSEGMLVYRFPRIDVTWEERDWLKSQPFIKTALEGEELTTLTRPPFEDKRRLVAVTPIPSIGWAAGAGRREEEAMYPIVSALALHTSLSALVAIASFLIALALSRTISVPIKKTEQYALHLHKQNENFEPSGPSEVRHLALTLISMTTELQSARAKLMAQNEELRSANETLRESEARFRTLADNISQFAWMADEKGSIFWYNERWYEYTGTTLEEMQGWGWKSIHHHDHVDRVVERFQHSINTGEPWEDVFPLRGKDGQYRWFLSRALPICDENGKILRWFGTNTDVTAQRGTEDALRESEMRFKLLSETAGRLLASPNPQVIINELCQRVMDHLECHAFFNFLGDEKAGKLHLNAFAGIPNEHVCEIEWLDYGVAVCGCVAEEGRRIVAEDIFNTPDIRTDLVKSYGIQAYACHPLVARGRVIGTLSFGTKTRPRFSVEDLALMKTVADQVATAMERMMLIEGLRKSRDELELRVQKRTAELQAYMVKLQESNQTLQDFASIASHDLQEPLRKVMAFGDRLKTKCSTSLGEEGCDYLDRMQKATSRMQALIQSLLDYSRVTTKAAPFTDVDLYELVQEVITDLEVRIEETGGKIEVGELPAIQADPEQMRQLFQNLLVNALKYHQEDEEPIVKVYGRRSAGGVQEIIVEDKGIGFSEQYLDKIFAPFHRLHGRTSHFEGTGMGLAICRKIVERHGGSITAKSTPGEGSTFLVNLPLRQNAGPADRPNNT